MTIHAGGPGQGEAAPGPSEEAEAGLERDGFILFTSSEQRENLRMKDPEIRFFVFRHFTPGEGYPEDSRRAIVWEEAQEQAMAIADVIAKELKEGDCVGSLGSGPKKRHELSEGLLGRVLEDRKIRNTSTPLLRPSLRNVSFDLLPEEYKDGRTIQRWMEAGDGLPSGVEPSDRVLARASRIIPALVGAVRKFRTRDEISGTTNVFVFTSAEFILPYVRALIGKTDGGRKLLEQNPDALYHIDPGEGFEIRVRGDRVQVLYPVVQKKGTGIIRQGSFEDVLSPVKKN